MKKTVINWILNEKSINNSWLKVYSNIYSWANDIITTILKI